MVPAFLSIAATCCSAVESSYACFSASGPMTGSSHFWP